MDALLDIAWSCLSHEAYTNPCFDLAFPTFEAFSTAFTSSGLTFCAGLSDVIEADDPPPVSWFVEVRDSFVEDCKLVPAKTWALYLHVMSKPGCPTLLYIGSATESTSGLRRRLKDYRLRHAISTEVLGALNDGYDITCTVLLAECSLPAPAGQPVLRALFLVLEAAFDAIFWPMRNNSTSYGQLGDNVIWPPSSLSWSGLCTHSPLIEGIKGLDLSSAELEKAAEIRRLKKNENLRAWTKERNKAMRANPTPEFKAERTKINKRRYKSKKAKRDSDVANAAHHCDLCDKNYTSAKELENHKQTPLHTKRAERGQKDFICAPCDSSFPNRVRFERHCASAMHKRNSSSH